MRGILIILVAVGMIAGCRPAKKVQRIQEAISKVDTSQVVIISEKAIADSINRVKSIYQKVLQNNIDFKTFTAKVRVEYNGKELGDEATAFIRMKKDSAIWLSLRGALGIEGFRVVLTRDSAKVMNLLKKTVQLRSISWLQEVTELPFDFYTLQDLVIGNPVFIDSNIASYKVDANNQLNVLMTGNVFKHLVTLDNTSFRLLHSKLDDADVIRNRTCDITFGGYETVTGIPFSTKRNISVAEHAKLDINLDFKQYSFNQPVTFPFNIPKNYKRQ